MSRKTLPPHSREAGREILSSREIMADNLTGGLVDFLACIKFGSIVHLSQNKDRIIQYLLDRTFPIVGFNSPSSRGVEAKDVFLAQQITASGVFDIIYEYCDYLIGDFNNILVSNPSPIKYMVENNQAFISQFNSLLSLARGKSSQEKIEAIIMVFRLFFLLDYFNSLSKNSKFDISSTGFETRMVEVLATQVSLYDDDSYAKPLFLQMQEYYNSSKHGLCVGTVNTLSKAKPIKKELDYRSLKISFTNMLYFFKNYCGDTRPLSVMCQAAVHRFPNLSFEINQKLTLN